jgi:hypothetical protein
MQDSVDKTGLTKDHPIIKFAKNPELLESAIALDDTVIWGALSLMTSADDKAVAEFSQRLRDRRLYKCIDVRDRIEALANDEFPKLQNDRIQYAALIDSICAKISESVSAWNKEDKSHKSRILQDLTQRNPYKRVEESSGPLNQIRIKTGDGKIVDIVEKSRVVAAIEPFKVFRLYVASDDKTAREYIESIIKNEVEDAKRNR